MVTVPSHHGPLFSAIVAVKDRTDRLEIMLPSWMRCNKIFDFVVVDWGSKIPVVESQVIQEQMSYYPNLKIIRVEDQEHFYRCKALNLARKHTNQRMKILLKLDVDYVNIDHGWMDIFDGQNIWYNTKDNTHELGNYFIVGSNFSRSSFGFMVVDKWAFDKAGSYNENLLPIWGYEDDDLYQRLCLVESQKDCNNALRQTHLEKIPFFLFEKFIYHIPHSNEDRKINMPEEFRGIKLSRLIELNKENAKNPSEKQSKYYLVAKHGNYLQMKEETATCCKCDKPVYDYVITNKGRMDYCENHHKEELIMLGFCRTLGLMQKDNER